VDLFLFYGKDFFAYFRKEEVWDDLLTWLKQWKKGLPEMPVISFDRDISGSFEEIKTLEVRYWRKIIENDLLWREGVMRAIFPEREVWNRLCTFFGQQPLAVYKNLAKALGRRLDDYYG